MSGEELRVELLLKVFEAFDLDGSGQVETSELLHLGEKLLKKIHRDLDGDRANARMSPRISLAGDLSGPGELPSKPASPADQPIMFRRTKSALSQLSYTVLGTSGSASPGNTTSCLAVEAAELNQDMMDSGGVLSPSKQSSDPSMRNALKDQPAISGASDRVGSSELLLLGRMRRQLCQTGEGCREGSLLTPSFMDVRRMMRLGGAANGNLSELNFVQHFNSTLPADKDGFEQLIGQFMQCARAYRKRKMAQRKGR